MQLLAVGLNHTTAPVSLREKVAFPADQLGQAVASACAWFGNTSDPSRAQETAILSTCNRVEIIARAEGEASNAIPDMVQFLAHYHHKPHAQIEPYLYHHQQGEAIRHLFRVASSLDSMIADPKARSYLGGLASKAGSSEAPLR